MIRAIAAAVVLQATPAWAQSALREAAVEFSDNADVCLLDVRDNGLKYDRSYNCQRLKLTSKKYIDAGGHLPETPPDIALIAERGRATAWTARALSAGAPLSLW